MAAAWVPSAARTQAKAAAPCWTAIATWVPMSKRRFTTGPKAAAYSAMVPKITGTPTGPQLAEPTRPMMLLGTPLSNVALGGMS